MYVRVMHLHDLFYVGWKGPVLSCHAAAHVYVLDVFSKGFPGTLQVIAVEVRSFGRVGSPVLPVDREMDYPSLINRALPADIRILGWTPVDDTFSAR